MSSKQGKPMSALRPAATPHRGRTVKKLPRETLEDLRNRAGYSAAEVARLCEYKSTNGYIRYEYEKQGDKLIPYPVIRKLLPLFVGRGTPPIIADELVAISEARTLSNDVPTSAVPPPQSSIGTGGGLRITLRVEPGVFLERSQVGTKNYGESNLLPAFDVEARAQFAAVVSDDPKRTVLHCVKPEQVGRSHLPGKRCVCMTPRGTTDLVEVVLRTINNEGVVPGGTVLGVVIGAYSRE